MSLTILKTDITTVRADAIVNSSNPLLLGFSGVDEILHERGGAEFEKECRAKAGTLLPGEAVFTRAYNIPAKYVIHTHALAYRGGTDGEAAILRSCYRSSLELADQLGCRSVAFPLIAAGTMGFPIPRALEIAVVSIHEYLQSYAEMDVFLVLYGKAAELIEQSPFADLDTYIRASAENVMLHEAQSLDEARSLDEAKSLEQMIANPGEDFVTILFRYMNERGIDKPSQLYKAACVSKQVFSKLISGAVTHPSMETVVGLAFALHLSYDEAVYFFNAAGLALSAASKYDIIVTYFLQHGNYDIWEFNQQLLKYGYSNLIGAE